MGKKKKKERDYMGREIHYSKESDYMGIENIFFAYEEQPRRKKKHGR